MKITTKRKAKSIQTDTLFTHKKTATIGKYDNSKYEWTGKASNYVGKDVENVFDGLLAVYVERRTNSDGPYAQVMCVTVQE